MQYLTVWLLRKTLLHKENLLSNDYEKINNTFLFPQTKMFEKQCYATWANGETFCLGSKSLISEKQCLIVWPGPCLG